MLICYHSTNEWMHNRTDEYVMDCPLLCARLLTDLSIDRNDDDDDSADADYKERLQYGVVCLTYIVHQIRKYCH